MFKQTEDRRQVITASEPETPSIAAGTDVVETELEYGVTGRPMPPLKRIPPANIRYYKFHFQDDGFPAQRQSDGSLYRAPIYPCYVAKDYLDQYKQTRDPDALNAAKIVVDAALADASPFHDALVLWYEGDSRVDRAVQRHYSGLTQARYTKVLRNLAVALDDQRYAKLARKFARALAIPAADGGVARVFSEGKGIEELPTPAADLVLNGWLTILNILAEKPQFLKRAGLDGFLSENLDLLEHLLPRYDVPALHNSRYSLSSPVRMRLLIRGAPIMLRNASVRWSKTEAVKLEVGKIGVWRNAINATDLTIQPDGSILSTSNEVNISLVFSQLASSNALIFTAFAKSETDIDVEFLQGDYSALKSSPVNLRWIKLDTIKLGTTPRDCEITVGAPYTDLVGYPTDFVKAFDGVHRNEYHPMHINALLRLYRVQKRSAFLDYAQHWARYIANWQTDPHYEAVRKINYASHIAPQFKPFLDQPVSSGS